VKKTRRYAPNALGQVWKPSLGFVNTVKALGVTRKIQSKHVLNVVESVAGMNIQEEDALVVVVTGPPQARDIDARLK